jgi:hypothetical protein
MGPIAIIRNDEAAGAPAASDPSESVPALDPAVLRSELRALAAADPAGAAGELPVRVAAALWDDRRGDLEDMGVGLADLRAATGGFRRELWLWMMGERTWAQTASSVAGRAVRRVA